MRRKRKAFLSLVLAAALCSALFAVPTTASAASSYKTSKVYTYNGHMYQFVLQGLSRKDAASYAKSVGGHLATITSAKEQNFVWKKLQANTGTFSGDFWIGAHKTAKGKWKWDTGEKFKYTNWGDGEPNNLYGTQEYIVLNHYSDGTWDDEREGGDRSTGCVIEWDGYVTSYQLSYKSITMSKGSTAKLSVITKPTYGSYSKLSFKSSNTKVAKVSKTGKITAKKKGSATITVTMKVKGKNYKKTCKVKVVS